MSEEQEKQEQVQEQTEGSGNLLDEIVAASKLQPADEGYALTRTGLQVFIKELAGAQGTQKISGVLVDEMIAELDSKLSAQVNEILHNEDFAKLESAWRSMKFLVDNTDFRQNIKVEFINVSKQDLLDDFEDAPEVVKSGLYKQGYTAEYGQRHAGQHNTAF